MFVVIAVARSLFKKGTRLARRTLDRARPRVLALPGIKGLELGDFSRSTCDFGLIRIGIKFALNGGARGPTPSPGVETSFASGPGHVDAALWDLSP